MTGIHPLALVLLAALAAPRDGVAGAQATSLAASIASHADTTLDPTIAREIESARARGIPAEPLLAKVREGRLKRATAPRIRSAVALLATRLDSARAALGPGASAGELVAGAEALAAGADATAVRAIGGASAGRPVSAPLGALAQLVASGVPSPRAVALIVDLLRRRATAAQVIAFGNVVESDAAGGLPAEESARFRWREFGVNAGIGADALSAVPGVVEQATGASSSPPRTPRRRP